MSKMKRPGGVRTAVILILILPVLGIGLRLMNEDKAPSKKAPAREIDLSVDVSQLGYEETVAYINERCSGFTYWEAGSSSNFKVTTLPVALDRDGKMTLAKRYASGGVVSSSWFSLHDVAVSERETKDAATGSPYVSIRFECEGDCISYSTTVPGRADPADEPGTTDRATLACVHGDQAAAALNHARRLLGDPAPAME